MRLTKEEKQALYKDIAEDIPEYYRIFSPWMWLWLTQLMLVLIGGSILLSILTDAYYPSFINSPWSFFGLLMIPVLCVVIPNLYTVYGYTEKGARYTRVICKIYIALGIYGLSLPMGNAGYIYIWQSIPIIASAIAIYITNTVRYQAYCLHRKRCMDWARERVKKNKAFVEKIKENRRRAGQK